MDVNGQPAATGPTPARHPVLQARINKMFYGTFFALRDTHVTIDPHTITAFIGPSGCGKSSALRCINRMNDLVQGFRLEGEVIFRGKNVYDRKIDPVAVRRNIGMVFQQPNPFAMSIYDNVAFGPRLNGIRKNLDDRVESALRRAVLWDEVKDKLRTSGLALSGGQQQRLCIARAIATEPEVLLMDEPCSALDPIATLKIEELMVELKKKFTIVIVTHNMQQAQRVADFTAFMYVDTSQGGRTGYLVEFAPSKQIFHSPHQELTQKYIAGAFG
jgi:phosphate transport system ATP-binding protein